MRLQFEASTLFVHATDRDLGALERIPMQRFTGCPDKSADIVSSLFPVSLSAGQALPESEIG
jgi:hypothetical protein